MGDEYTIHPALLLCNPLFLCLFVLLLSLEGMLQVNCCLYQKGLIGRYGKKMWGMFQSLPNTFQSQQHILLTIKKQPPDPNLKACELNRTDEIQMVENFKDAFQEYDPFLMT